MNIPRIVVLLLLSVIACSSAFAWNALLDRTLVSEDYEFFVNEDSCIPLRLEKIREAADLWSFYSLAVDAVYRGNTSVGERIDYDSVISCASLAEIEERYGIPQEREILGITRVRPARLRDRIISVDTVLNNDIISPCDTIHEMGHALGLGHSSYPTDAIMRAGSRCHRFSYDDIVGIADIYGAPANCTPYVDKDLHVYFPYVEGGYLVIAPVDRNNLSLGFVTVVSGESVDYEKGWQCDLSYTENLSRLEGTFYYNGDLLALGFSWSGDNYRVRLLQ